MSGELITEDLDVFSLDEGELETRNRLRNLMWTVSGNYTQDTDPDYASFRESKYISFYDAIKQGGLARYFDQNALAEYMLKKLQFQAQADKLTNLAQLCVDAAVYPHVVQERPGTKQIRDMAFSDLLDKRFRRLSETTDGRLKLAYMRSVLTGSLEGEKRIREPLEQVRALERAQDTMDVIRTVDSLYNALIDPYFERVHGTLEQVLAFDLGTLSRDDWREFLSEEAYEDMLEKAAEKLTRDMSQTDLPAQEDQPASQRKYKVLQIDREAAEKMYGYIEKNFGRTYLSERETKMLNYRLCRGMHEDCSLYYTEGILNSHVMVNAQYVNAKKQAANNLRYYKNTARVAQLNIRTMTEFLRRSLVMRTMRDRIPSDHGSIIASRAWRIGRVKEPGKLFYRETKQNRSDFAVTILMDASGSQHERQAMVALQGYIISAALSGAGIPHQIMSFCTFWDYTVMQRFRDFDDPPEKDAQVLQYTTSSNNRDGLAIRAAGDALERRQEENKILIVLSDGRPNDVIVGRPGSRNPQPYTGETALRDTAYEVRTLRGRGVYVLGVYTGKDEDLQAEKRIFGKDFAYIRDIRHFSQIVSSYLQKLLEQDTDEI